MQCSNEVILETLRHVQFRQVPWYKQSMIFDFLQSIGLVKAKRSDYAVNGSPRPQIIALLTPDGRGEIHRLAKLERDDDWSTIKKRNYAHRIDSLPEGF